MNKPIIDSALDLASWFLQQSQKEDIFVEDEKLQSLIFLSQVHYAIQNEKNILIPSTFLIDEYGVFEPTLAKLQKYKQLKSIPTRIDENIQLFLEKIWKTYAFMPVKQIRSHVKSLTKDIEIKDLMTSEILDFNNLIEKLKIYSKIDTLNTKNITKNKEGNEKKVLMSQNGPVIVTQWHPRKV